MKLSIAFLLVSLLIPLSFSQDNSQVLSEDQQRILLGQLIDYGKTIDELKACKERLTTEDTVVASERKACQAEIELVKSEATIFKNMIDTLQEQVTLNKEKAEFFEKAYNTCKRKPSRWCKFFSIVFTLGTKKCN